MTYVVNGCALCVPQSRDPRDECDCSVLLRGNVTGAVAGIGRSSGAGNCRASAS